MDFLDLPRVTLAAGSVALPGSKSISNRALLLAALARGTTRLERLLDSDDTRVMREALEALGVRMQAHGTAESLSVTGIGGHASFPVKKAEIFLGNSGTSARALAAVLAFCDGNYRLSGVPRMHERPIGDLADALIGAGAQIEWLGTPGFPPLAIGPRRGVALSKLRIKGDTSSQFVSGLLMALPLAKSDVTVEIAGELVSKPYVDLTLSQMAQFGVEVERDGWKRFTLHADARYTSPGTVHVEGDASSASYFLAAGALGGGPVRVEGVGRESVQGDVAFTRVLEAMGATIHFGDDWIECAGRPRLRAFDLDMNRIPDAAMTAAVLALFAEGTSTLRNIASWRVKETDRIAAMATELRKLGAQVEEGSDSLRVTPPVNFLSPRASGLSPVSVATYDDHRMAMCFSLASFGPVPIRIEDPGCV
ncbi:MAG: 3-phosphoshikimate 1-carboxyvinyltransferase, partial [Bacillota bacterium]